MLTSVMDSMRRLVREMEFIMSKMDIHITCSPVYRPRHLCPVSPRHYRCSHPMEVILKSPFRHLKSIQLSLAIHHTHPDAQVVNGLKNSSLVPTSSKLRDTLSREVEAGCRPVIAWYLAQAAGCARRIFNLATPVWLSTLRSAFPVCQSPTSTSSEVPSVFSPAM
jgi:hypothetical protein